MKRAISMTNQSLKRIFTGQSTRRITLVKVTKPRQRRGLNFRLESTEKSSLEVLDFRDATLTFEGLNRPIIKGLEVGVSEVKK